MNNEYGQMDINEWQDYILCINWLNNNVLALNDYMEQMQS